MIDRGRVQKKGDMKGLCIGGLWKYLFTMIGYIPRAE